MSRLPRAVRVLIIAAIAIAAVIALVLGAASVTTFAQDTVASSRAPSFQAIIIPADASSALATFEKVLSPLDGGKPLPKFTDLGSITTGLGKHSLHSGATVADAEAHAGAKLPQVHRLPTTFTGVQPSVYTGDAGTVIYKLDIANALALMSGFHIATTGLPDPSVTPTATFVLNVPPSAAYVYQSGSNRLAVGVLANPTLNVPPTMNLDQLRTDVLGFPGLPPGVSNELHAIHDWQHLLVVPLPAGATSSQLSVHGSPAMLVQDPQGVIVVWQSNGNLYFVAGQGITGADAIAVASGVQE
ncbi:MAG TPA: hypothetical protein VFN57_18270 [Thermomicrobiaceae bacterium]|nr:hypothetical protein [Thermomicrobiaceae bacterium]